ncbi:hypothetical protein Tdes44962_MAKER09454 [Teratosphaeria destructans]|uniref:Uncharacterized protein n=1 Tax=Teratosphaeria destructans TaxID=418781 RepID=A0A9W7W2W8_9PEZI|nr:hypothetical protein Tdes44962_MAKER09454 [Teratosphaeria destructans]
MVDVPERLGVPLAASLCPLWNDDDSYEFPLAQVLRGRMPRVGVGVVVGGGGWEEGKEVLVGSSLVWRAGSVGRVEQQHEQAEQRQQPSVTESPHVECAPSVASG